MSDRFGDVMIEYGAIVDDEPRRLIVSNDFDILFAEFDNHEFPQ